MNSPRDSDRRFCFEVITPTFKRVYQAQSGEDMNEWIAGINFCACFRAFGVRAMSLDAVTLATAQRELHAAQQGLPVGSSVSSGLSTMSSPSWEVLRARIQARRR